MALGENFIRSFGMLLNLLGINLFNAAMNDFISDHNEDKSFKRG